MFLLTVVAQNSEFSCHRGRLQIKVVVLRDRIEFPDLDPVSVPEDARIGTEVAQVMAMGGSGNGSITYSLESGGPGEGVFSIDPLSGSIILLSELDFETLDTYSLVILGTGDQTSGTGSASLEVRVLDINERPSFATPCARIGFCEFTVSENRNSMTVVDVLIGSDPDLPSLPNGEITFELLNDGTGLAFIIIQNGITAVIVTTASFDRETEPSFEFRVRISDNGVPQLSSEVTVRVVIADLNDNAPVFVQASLSPTLRESAGLGPITEYAATDADIGVNADITYSLSSPTNSELPFSIDPFSGILSISRSLDFELVTNYPIVITASNPDGLSSSVDVTVLVVDVNDNPPVFSRDVYTASVTEGASVGTQVDLDVIATDADSGLNGRIVFSIEEGNFQDSFEINETANGFAVISVIFDIDRETIPLFELTIRASDLGSPTMSDLARVRISVLDVNDNAPIFTRESYELILQEDTQPMDVLLLSAFDIDQPLTPNSVIDFTLDQTTNIGQDFDLIDFDDNTAQLRLIGQLDFDEMDLYELRVVASDRGIPRMISEAIIRVMVTDLNQFPPIVSGNQTINVSESETPGLRIAQFTATDLDDEVLIFAIRSIVGDDGAEVSSTPPLFSVDPEGYVILGQQLDFESSQFYIVTITVSDGAFSTVAVLTVNVISVNEFNPIIEDSLFSIAEEEDVGSFVGTVVASDGDAVGFDSILTYGIIRDSAASLLFRIDPENGSIFTTQQLDREALVEQGLFVPSRGSIEIIRIVVTDGGMPSRLTVAPVEILLEDINDNSPNISVPFAVNTQENLTAGVLVAHTIKTDRDIGVNAELTFSLSVFDLPPDAPTPFLIDEAGILRNAIMLDAEEKASYLVSLTATDGGEPSLSNTVTLVVLVIDINDNRPEFVEEQYEVMVPEDIGIASAILQVEAVDIDITLLNFEVRYEIQSTIPPESISLFSILPESGIISAQVPLDFETQETHILTIIARDQGFPQMSSLATVNVTLRNVDEVPPVFLTECSISISEETTFTGVATPIGQCLATDIDEVTGDGLPGVPLVYEIVEGNIGDTFSITNAGTVFLERIVDREDLDFYSILVRVSDPAGLSSTTLLNVTILDINDNSPEILNSVFTEFITADNIRDGEDNFFSLDVIDRDVGINANFFFSIDQITMAIDGMRTMITVRVVNGVRMVTTLITLDFEIPCFLQNHGIGAEDGRLLSFLLCDVSIEPTSTDIAVNSPLMLTCTALSNLLVDYAFIHNNNAVVATDSTLSIPKTTFSDAGEYVCQAATRVGNLLSTNAVVRIQGTV